ncbi:cysteine desulfurase-like protein [Vibrio ostreicida]|uniref:Cysteine desulfurase-like protein n=1 Tax=Vibrio ostreicida TaxID=526588 RepID=A0ABT8BU86_9VIBR|nr:cysteine desulfurase-like protein [Vibrio ostreicida]MDN3610269.1 cysteine desulfurase-like protein [Vibrio ostreicida]NPD07716.1 cysteine desulfurase-like protein [Vibrio ostreicida]
MHFTPNLVRMQFRALQQTYNNRPVMFCDGPGGSQVPDIVLEAMTSYLGFFNANLGGHYFSSQHTGEIVTRARESAQAFVNAESSDNMVFGANMTSLTFQLSRAISREWQPEDEIVVTALDHYANVSSWQQAAEDKGASLRQARVDEKDGSLDIEHLVSLINRKTKLVAVGLASNTTGSITDIKRVIAAAHQVGAKVYVDAVHYAPHNLVDVQALGCDFLACSAYKFFGPHVGMAYVAPQWLKTLTPYKVEPATDIGPGRFETGTQSFESLAGVIAAVKYLSQWGIEQGTLRRQLIDSYAQFNQHETALSERFLMRLSRLQGVQLVGRWQADSQVRTPTFALTFDNHRLTEITQQLGQKNICVGSGHFYALGLVRQLGLESQGGVLRIGFMHYNTLEEVDRLMDELESIIHPS